MGSINSHKYPEHDIEQAVGFAEIIHNKGITKPELLADQMGHETSEGGAFRNKITSLRRYGLISGRGDLNLSSIAERIVAPRPGSNERREATAQAVLNVDLLQKLYERLDYELPSDEIWYDVVEVTGCDRAEAQEKSSDIKHLYEAGLQYVKELHETEEPTEVEEPVGGATTEPTSLGQIPEDADARLITHDATIDIRNSPTYAAAKALFESIGQKYQSSASDSDDDDSDQIQFNL